MPDSPATAERPAESRRLLSPDIQPAETTPETADTGRANLALRLLDPSAPPPPDGADDSTGAGAGTGGLPQAAGAGDGAGSGAGGTPGAHGPAATAQRRAVATADLLALQRFAGNRAVSGVTAPRAAGSKATVQRAPKAVVETDGDFEVNGVPANDPRVQDRPKPIALQVDATGLDQAASRIAEGIKDNRGDHIIIGVQPTLIVLYDKQGKRISEPIAMKLPEGVKPDPGVFFLPPGGISRRVMVDPTTLDWSAGDLAGLLVEQKQKPGAPAGAGAHPTAPPPTPAASGSPATAAGGQSAGGQPAGGQPAGPTVYDLRKFVTNQAAIDQALVGHEQAANWFVVPHHDGGSGKKGGVGNTTGFAGELAGAGTGDPPNRPPWPVRLDGPKMLPSNATGTWDANINWAANGNDGFSSQVISAVGTDIHYRWELFDISAVAAKHEAAIAAQARQTREAIKKADAKNLVPPAGPGTPTPAAGQGGAGSPTPAPNAAPADPTAADPTAANAAAPAPDDDYDAQVDAKTHAKSGTGDEVTGREAADKAFKDDWRNLWKDTVRAHDDLRAAKGDTPEERQSNAAANMLALEMLPASALVTAVGSSLRWLAEVFAGEHKQMEVPFENEGTFLVRVIATPRQMTDKDGNKIIYASSVASGVVRITSTDKMLREALDTPGADEQEADTALKKAQQQTPQDVDRIKRLTLEAELARLQNTGDPLALIDKQIEIKTLDLEAARKRWEGIAVGPILDIERQLDTLRNRRDVYELQERRRRDGDATMAPPTRLNASLISEVTGQRYPLLLSAGPMAMDGTRHHWKVLDATSEDSEGFDGYGATEALAFQSALDKFGGKAQFGRGTIGVRVPASLQASAHLAAEYRAVSQPAGWAIAKSRIDDLVAVLAALGLLVTTAGTAAAVIGAAVAAARLIERYHNGTLRVDAGLVTDLLSVLGGTGAIAQEAATLLRAQRLGDMVVIMEEGVADATKFEEAASALKTATSIASGIETANEVLNYAGLVWGNVTFVDSMLSAAEQEATGAISHAEARRQRAMAIGGAINNNGMFVAGKAIHAHQAAKAAGATEPRTTGGQGEHETPTGGSDRPPTRDTETPKTGDAGAGGGHDTPPTDAKAGVTDDAHAGARDEHQTGAPDEAGKGTGQTGHGTAGSDKAGTGAPATAGGGQEVAGHGSGTPAARPSATGAGARDALVQAARGHGDLAQAARDAIGSGTWKGDLASALAGLDPVHRQAAEKALVDAREALVNEAWAEVQKDYPDLWLENAGTRSFGSDIDGTIRPKAEASGTGGAIGDQVKQAGEAAQKLSDLLRSRVGGETDAKIDTNIYSFIGEGRVRAPDSAAAGAQQHVDLVVGLAEQMRGQSEAGFKDFEKRLESAAGDPRVAAEAKAVLGEARQFHDARQAEWADAKAKAKAANPKDPPAAIERAARESLLAQKKGELAGLLGAPQPDYGAIAGKQSEINWFAPDAYATPSAFRQAVAHGQRLKGSARTAAEYTGGDVAAKYRETAAGLPPDSPRARQLTRDAALVESQQRLLESTLSDLKQATAESPSDGARVADLEARARQLKEAIAAKAEPIVVGELLDTTMPADKPGPERLNEAAAASAANMGMLEDHVTHAKNADAKVKAAAKYAGRIAMAEFLGGLRPDLASPIGRLIGEFVQSRWGIFEDIGPAVLRDMFLRYALETGRGRDVVHDEQGVPVGVTDDLKARFVDDVRQWARDTNADIQTSAIASKAFTNPAEANAGAAGGSRPGGAAAGDHATVAGDRPSPPVETTARPDTDEAVGKGGAGTGANAPDNRATGPADREGGAQTGEEPAPAADGEPARKGGTPAAGVVAPGASPEINPPGVNRPFDFRLRSLAEGHAALRRLGQGDASILTANGVQLPADYTSQAREFGLAQMPDGTFAIVQGAFDHVNWEALPPGTVALAHSHPLTEGRQLRQNGTVAEIAARHNETTDSDEPGNATLDRVHVFPSAGDLVYCAAHNVANHDVQTPYVHLGDGVLRTPTGAPGEIPVSFNIAESRHTANFGQRPVAEAGVVAHDANGNVLWIGRMWGFEVNGSSMIFFERPDGLSAPDPTTLNPDHTQPAGSVGSGGGDDGPPTVRPAPAPAAGSDDAPATRRDGAGAGASGGGIPDIPGGVSVTDDGVATWVRSRKDGNAIVRIEETPSAILVTDIYRKSLPKGSGSAMLAEGLRHLKVGPGAKIVIGEIINPETVASYKAQEDPSTSLLGKTTQRALEMIGLTPASVTWQMRAGKLTIVMEVQ